MAPWLGASLLLHLLIGASLLLLPQPDSPREFSLRMVRLVGGGQNKPGWVKPEAPRRLAEEEQAAARERLRSREVEPEPVVEQVPVPEPPKALPKVETPTRGPEIAPVVKPEPAKVEERAASPEPTAAEAPREQTPAESVPAESTEQTGEATVPASEESMAGAAGAGTDRSGARADQSELPGLRAYLLRAEQSVARQFRYPARGSGKAAVYHFFVDRRGRIQELELREPSGLPGLDLAGRGALQRAVLPPLPPSLRIERLGVTYTFRDE